VVNTITVTTLGGFLVATIADTWRLAPILMDVGLAIGFAGTAAITIIALRAPPALPRPQHRPSRALAVKLYGIRMPPRRYDMSRATAHSTLPSR
jgi:hypothetical protein